MDKMTLEELQDELKVLKNEIKTTLMDVREQLLTYVENPFSAAFTREEPPRETPPKPQTVVQVESAHVGGNGPPGPGPVGGNWGAGPFAGPSGQFQAGGWGGPMGGMGPVGAVPVMQFHPTGAPAGSYAAGATEAAPPAATPPPSARPAARAVSHEVPADVRPQPIEEHQGPVRQPEDHPHADGLRQTIYQEARVPPARAPRDARKPAEETPGEPEVATEPEETAGPPKRMPTLLQVATLSPWLEQGLRRVGRDRLKAIIEVYTAMGGMSPQLGGLLLKLISLSDNEQAKPGVPLGECLAVLAELDNLVYRSRLDPTGAALLSALLKKNGATGQPW